MFAVSVTFLSMSQAATAVCGDDAVATLSALSCPLASMAGVTHGKNFVGDVLLETDVVRGRPGTMSGLSESILGCPKPEGKRCNIFRGTTGVLRFRHPSTVEANPGHSARTSFCSQACTNILSRMNPFA